MTKQPRRKHPRVVEDQQVSGTQQLWKFAESPVFQRTGTHVQQPRSRAFGRRMLRNQLWRQRKIEIGNKHGNNYRACLTLHRKVWRSAFGYGTMRDEGKNHTGLNL